MPMLNLRLIDAGGADRYFAHRRARRHPRSRRQDRDRRRGDAEQADGVAEACAKSCRWSRRRCRSSAISRPATRAPCAARLRMPIRARNAAGAGGARRRGRAALAKRGERVLAAEAISERHADDGARGRRADRRGAFSGDRRARASPSAKWRAGTATSPSSRWRPSPTGDGAVRLGVGGMAGRPVVRAIDGDAPRRDRRMGGRARRLRRPARLGGDAARSVPQSRAAVIEEAADAPREQGRAGARSR